MTYQPVWDEAAPTVAAIARPGDLVITVGCGDVTKVAPLIVGELQAACRGGPVSRPGARVAALLIASLLLGVAAARRRRLSGVLLARCWWSVRWRWPVNEQLRADQVIAAAAVPLGTPLARQDVDSHRRRATTLPAVQAASVTRTWPGTMMVTVTERRPLFAVRQPGGFPLVDAAGVAFAETGRCQAV